MPDIFTRLNLKRLTWQAAKKPARAEPTIFVIDPGCTAAFGHHRSINQIIYDEAQTTETALEIYTGRMAKPEALGFAPLPVFSDVVYAGMPETDARSVIDRHNDQILMELLQNMPALKAGDRVIVHTASITMLKALGRWLKLYARPDLIVSIVMMLVPYSNPGRKGVSQKSRRDMDAAYRTSFEALRALPLQLKIFAETKEMAATYEAIAGGPVEISPLPIEFHHHRTAKDSSGNISDEPVFLFAGDNRPEKGILLMPEAIALYNERGGKGRFVIQCGEPPKDQGPKAAAIAELQALTPQVTLVTDSFTGPGYFAFLDQGDILLVPYDPAHYGTIRPSRILLEGLGLGKPVITTAGTWMEATLEGLDRPCGTLMTSFDAQALCQAMLEAHTQRAELTRNAQQIAPQIRHHHNEAAYLCTILQKTPDDETQNH